MFQTNAEFLSLLGQFVAAGVVIAVLCDIVRFLRIAAGAGKAAVFVTDVIMTVISAVIVFFVTIETGAGKPRLYYFLAAALGMAVYFFTIGIVTKFIAGLFGKLFSRIKKSVKGIIYNPLVTYISFIRQKMLNVFEQMRQKTSKYAENLHFGLKKHTTMLYNNKIGKLCTNGGEERNVVKAKVRKKA